MKVLFSLILSLLIFASCSSSEKEHDGLSEGEKIEIVTQINALMEEQENCWNEGDVECFMKHYWKSKDLMFVGKNLTYGWQNTLDNYKKGYPDRQAMGQLTFDNIKVEPVSDTHCFVVGSWNLKRDQIEDLGGHYSLLWRKNEKGEWVIIIDHSS